MEVQGTIKQIMKTETFASGFQKRSVVITTAEQYPQHIIIEFLKDKTTILDSFKVGDNVTVGINLNGREWTSPQGEVKYFNTIVGWKINKDGVKETQVNNAGFEVVAENDLTKIDNDLPF
jgi:hypothetical protein